MSIAIVRYPAERPDWAYEMVRDFLPVSCRFIIVEADTRNLASHFSATNSSPCSPNAGSQPYVNPITQYQMHSVVQEWFLKYPLEKTVECVVYSMSSMSERFFIPRPFAPVPTFHPHMEAVENTTKYVEEDQRRTIPNVVVTMTTCKRLHKWKESMISLLSSCADLYFVSKWIIVDDNSSEDDRSEMERCMPYATVIRKTPNLKGHPQSMNLIRQFLKTESSETTPIDFVFHTEDDWVYPKFELSWMISPMMHDSSIGFVLLGDRPAQTVPEFKHQKQVENYLPVVQNENLKSMVIYDFNVNHASFGKENHEFASRLYPEFFPEKKDCRGWWWPHGFSLNPGLWKWKDVYENAPDFSETCPHSFFELDYTFRLLRWFLETGNLGHKVCLLRHAVEHTGDDKSAYVLNNNARWWDRG